MVCSHYSSSLWTNHSADAAEVDAFDIFCVPTLDRVSKEISTMEPDVMISRVCILPVFTDSF
jgi:hypothetical protein